MTSCLISAVNRSVMSEKNSSENDGLKTFCAEGRSTARANQTTSYLYSNTTTFWGFRTKCNGISVNFRIYGHLFMYVCFSKQPKSCAR